MLKKFRSKVGSGNIKKSKYRYTEEDIYQYLKTLVVSDEIITTTAISDGVAIFDIYQNPKEAVEAIRGQIRAALFDEEHPENLSPLSKVFDNLNSRKKATLLIPVNVKRDHWNVLKIDFENCDGAYKAQTFLYDPMGGRKKMDVEMDALSRAIKENINLAYKHFCPNEHAQKPKVEIEHLFGANIAIQPEGDIDSCGPIACEMIEHLITHGNLDDISPCKKGAKELRKKQFKAIQNQNNEVTGGVSPANNPSHPIAKSFFNIFSKFR